ATPLRGRRERRQRAGADRDRLGLRADIDDPDQLGTVLATVGDRFVADGDQAALEERQHGVAEAGIRRLVVPAADQPRARQIRDVEADGAAVDVGAVGPVGTGRGDGRDAWRSAMARGVTGAWTWRMSRPAGRMPVVCV